MKLKSILILSVKKNRGWAWWGLLNGQISVTKVICVNSVPK